MMNIIKALPVEVQIAIESSTVVLETLANASSKSLEFAINFPQFVSYNHEEHMLTVAESIKPFIDTHTVLEIESKIQSNSIKTVDTVRNASQHLTDQELENNSAGFTERDLALAKFIRHLGNKTFQEAMNEGWV